jgi:hypothetical protein
MDECMKNPWRRLKMAEGSDLSQHINMFNQAISDLQRVNVKFEDEDKALMLLNSLQASTTYENLVATLTWGGRVLKSFAGFSTKVES